MSWGNSWGIVIKLYIFDFHVIMMDVSQNLLYALPVLCLPGKMKA